MTRHGVEHVCNSAGSMFTMYFTSEPVTDLRERSAARIERALREVFRRHARSRRLLRALAVRGELSLDGAHRARDRPDRRCGRRVAVAARRWRRWTLMPITCIGLSHHTAPVEVRERHAFPASRMAEALVALRDYEAVHEAVMLQTCGRLEIYAELDDYERGVAQIKSFLANFRHGATGYDLESYLYTLLGHQAVEHLFRVCTGLDSMLIGEAEILGQVKDAYVAATHAKSLGRTLHRLFREALAAGKTARAQTQIGGESASIATAAVDAARAVLGTLEGQVGPRRRRRQDGTHRRQAAAPGRRGARHRRESNDVALARARRRSRLRRSRRDAGTRRRARATPTSSSRRPARRTSSSTKRASARRWRCGRSVRSSSSTSRCRATPIRRSPTIAQRLARRHRRAQGASSNERLELRREAIPAVEEIIDEYVERFENWYHSRVAVPVIATADAEGRGDPRRGARAAVRALPRPERARAHADHRHDDDDRLEAAALGRF